MDTWPTSRHVSHFFGSVFASKQFILLGFSSIYLKWKFFKYLIFFWDFSKNLVFGVYTIPVASNFVKIRLSWNSTKFDWVTRFRETNSMVKFVSSFEI